MPLSTSNPRAPLDSRARLRRRWARAAAVAAYAALPLIAVAQPMLNVCGPIENAYGPYDYRTARNKLEIVERYHFKPEVEALIRKSNQSGVSIGGNLDYTLRASPNHHRALLAMTSYGARLKTTQVPGADYPVECYYDRALRFAPDDAVVRMLYARYLSQQGRTDAAVQQLEHVGRELGDNAITLYNVGLVYFDMKRYDKALEYDHRAKAQGWTRPELQQSLRAVGQWRDPPPAAVGSSPVAAPAGSSPAAGGAAPAMAASAAPGDAASGAAQRR